MTLTYGALFAGYGGLELGVQSVLGGHLSWYAEIDPAPSRVMAHHYPDVPNLGDVTKVDWTTVEPVDVLTGGTPCQDLSHAGKRKGMTDGTRSNLWVEMREAIAVLRPRLVAWENVRGALSASADSDLEPCPGCVGGPDDGAVLRALGRVLGDLADLRYDAWWYGLRAADVGAPHGRLRIFLFAVPADATGDPWWLSDGDRRAPADADLSGRGILGGLDARGRDADGRRGADADGDAAQSPTRLTLLPTPRTSDTNGAGAHGQGGMDLRTVASLLPTPTSRDHKGRNQRDDATCLTGALLPTPRATDGTNGGPNQRGSSGDLMLPSAVHLLPTPKATNNENRSSAWANGPNLGEAIALLPTPVADNSRGLPSSSTDFQSLPNAVCALLPTPTTAPTTGNGHARNLGAETRLLPTPAVNDMGAGKTVEAWDEWTARMKSSHGNGNGHGASLHIESLRSDKWGQYAPAIARWEAVLGRPAPAPTEVSTKSRERCPVHGDPQEGRPGEELRDMREGLDAQEVRESVGESCACKRRLSPEFVSWMMGLPEGWVTDRGLSRPDQLKCLGNGVVPQQAAAATWAWVCDMRAERAA